MDTLLLSRIDSLDENLSRVDDALERLRHRHASPNAPAEDRVAIDLWYMLDMEVRKRFERHQDALEALRAAAAGAAPGAENPWKTYARVREESERLFDECLEFIGALAFRHTGLDEDRMCQLADDVMFACAREAYGQPWTFLTVPSLRDVVTRSRLRLSRLRFPEWTFWTLPATAYVLGHEVLCEQKVASLVTDRMEGWARRDVARSHVPILIADVFAAYLMGPAYGHAAIRLRFDPSKAYAEDARRPAEASRAHVVLRTLECVPAYRTAEVWESQVKALHEQWDRALEAADPAGAPPDDPASLNELVEEALKHFDDQLSLMASYDQRSWHKAETLYDRWRGEAEASAAVDALSTEPTEQLLTARDVLNAAWLMRVDRPLDAARTERAASAMCRRVLFVGDAPAGGPGLEPIPIS
jgi:hypothetical protein